MSPGPDGELESLEMIRRLVGFDTTSRDSNLALIDFVRGYLAGLGVESTLVHDETGEKANLYATLGPTDRPGICLSGHTDVVPVDGQDWHTDPFELTEKDGKLYGRGTCDMKSWLAVALAHAPEFLARGLETPIHLALSYDEEVGCVGVRRLIERFGADITRPALCIVGEPSNMRVVRGHKGKRSYRCRVRGFEAHSSIAPLAVNAIEFAGEVITFLRAMAVRDGAAGRGARSASSATTPRRIARDCCPPRAVAADPQSGSAASGPPPHSARTPSNPTTWGGGPAALAPNSAAARQGQRGSFSIWRASATRSAWPERTMVSACKGSVIPPSAITGTATAAFSSAARST